MIRDAFTRFSLSERKNSCMILSPTKMLWRQFCYIFLRKIMITIKRTTMNRLYWQAEQTGIFGFQVISTISVKKKKKTTISAQINSFACLLHIPKALKQRNRVVVIVILSEYGNGLILCQPFHSDGTLELSAPERNQKKSENSKWKYKLTEMHDEYFSSFSSVSAHQ